MQAYAYDLTVQEKGVLTLKNLPFTVGEKLEVIIIQRHLSKPNENRYPFWGKKITYLNPTEPCNKAQSSCIHR